MRGLILTLFSLMYVLNSNGNSEKMARIIGGEDGIYDNWNFMVALYQIKDPKASFDPETGTWNHVPNVQYDASFGKLAEIKIFHLIIS